MPRKLTDDHKKACMATSHTLLQRYFKEVSNGGSKRVFHYSLESKAERGSIPVPLPKKKKTDKPGKGDGESVCGTCTESFWWLSLLVVQQSMPVVIRAL
jgi:hypothetical protein